MRPLLMDHRLYLESLKVALFHNNSNMGQLELKLAAGFIWALLMIVLICGCTLA